MAIQGAIKIYKPNNNFDFESGSHRLTKGVYNRLLVRAALFHRGPASRVELRQSTGLPLSALTDICRALIGQGYLRETSTANPSGNGRGRRRRLLEIDCTGLGVACLVYDRLRVEAAVADLSGVVRWQRRWEGPFEKGREQLAVTAPPAIAAPLSRRLISALKACLRAAPGLGVRLVAVGAADPGLVDRETGRALRAVNVPGWQDVPVREMLGSVAGLPVIVERGDGLQALGEVAFGAGRGVRSALFVTLVDGVGGGVVEEGRLVAGRDGAAGEIGHVNVREGGALCGCGLRGCLEAYVSPPRLLERLKDARARGVTSRVGRGAAEKEPDFPAMVRAAREGDPLCRSILAEAARMMAQAIGSAINLLNPERVILGGHLVEAGDVMLKPLRAALRTYAVREMITGLDVVTAERDDVSAFLGIVARLRETIFAYPASGAPMHA